MTIKLTKFQKKKDEILKRREQELRELEEEERRERRKMIDPVVEKISKIAEEQARSILERSPQILEEYSFRKRDATKALTRALEDLFQESQQKEEKPAQASRTDDTPSDAPMRTPPVAPGPNEPRDPVTPPEIKVSPE